MRLISHHHQVHVRICSQGFKVSVKSMPSANALSGAINSALPYMPRQGPQGHYGNSRQAQAFYTLNTVTTGVYYTGKGQCVSGAARRQTHRLHQTNTGRTLHMPYSWTNMLRPFLALLHTITVTTSNASTRAERAAAKLSCPCGTITCMRKRTTHAYAPLPATGTLMWLLPGQNTNSIHMTLCTGDVL